MKKKTTEIRMSHTVREEDLEAQARMLASRPRQINRILNLITDSPLSIAAIVASEGYTPNAFFKAIKLDKTLNTQYQEALKMRATTIHISEYEKTLREFSKDELANPRRAEAIMSGHRWLAEKLDKEQYGTEKLPTLQVNFNTMHLDSLRALTQTPAPTIDLLDDKLDYGKNDALQLTSD